MNPDPYDNEPGKPERGKRNLPLKPEKTLDEQIAELRQKAEQIIPSQLVRPIPLPEMEMAGIITRLEEKGVTVSPTSVDEAWVGGLRLLVAGIKELRVGLFKEIPSIAFCYAFSDQKQLKTVLVALPDGLEPLELAKAFVRGRIPTLTSAAQVKFLPVGEFFSLSDYDPEKLYDHHCLRLRQKLYEDGFKSRVEYNESTCAALRSEIQSLRPLAEMVPELQAILSGLKQDKKFTSQRLILVTAYSIIITLMLWVPHFIHR